MLDLLTALMPPAFFTDANLRSLVVIKAVDFSLEWGNNDASRAFPRHVRRHCRRSLDDYEAGLLIEPYRH